MKKLHLKSIISILFMITTLTLFSQSKKISGSVFDADGKTPMQGVTIIVQGKNLGTSSGAGGKYSINADANDALVFSFLGYGQQRVVVGSKSTIDVTMQEESTQIDNVVVTALGVTRNEQSLGYAVTKLDNREINTTVNNSWLTGLNGKVAGLTLEEASSGPGGSVRVVLRGEGSLSHDKNTALFVIDGIPMGSDMTNLGGSSYSNTDAPVDFGNGANDLNPDDIESISVLKGPAATALYGSRAANGAIIITTKKGVTKNGIGVTFNSAVSFERAGFWPDFQHEYGAGNANSSGRTGANDAAQYYSFWSVPANKSDNNTAYSRTQSRYAFGPRYEGQMFYQYKSYDWQNDTYTKLPWEPTDFYKGFFQTGVTYTNTVSVEGNSGKGSSYRVSAKDLRNTWIAPNTGYNAQTVNISVYQRLNKYIKADTKLTYYRKNSDNLPTSGYSQASPLYALLWTVPSVNIKDVYQEWASGRINQMLSNASSDGGKLINNGSGSARSENVYWLMNENLNSLNRNRIYGNLALTSNITKEITLMLRSGVDFNSDFSTQQKPQYSNTYPDGFYKTQQVTNFEMNNDFLLSYKKMVKQFSVDAAVGGNNMISNYRSISLAADKLSFPNVYKLQNSVDPLTVNQNLKNKSVNSLYGFINLGYKSTYYLDVTGRNDFSSTLPAANNSYFYPSVSTSVVLSNALNLKEKLSFLDMWRVRASWANVGNDTDPYSVVPSYTNSSFVGSYTKPTTLQNPNLKPENVESWEFGTEFRLFKERLTADIAYYRSKTTNQIIPVPVDPITGTAYEIINAGEVQNRGIEVATSINPIRTKDFNWTMNLTWSMNKNKLVSLASGVDRWSVNTNTIGSRVFIDAYPGTELGRIYGYGFERAPKGAFYINDNGDKVNCEGQMVINGTNGSPILDNQNTIDLGSIYPDWKAGMTQSIRYRNLSLDMTFSAQMGGHSYSVTNFALSYQGKLKNTLDGRYDGKIFDGVIANSDGTYSKNDVITSDIVDVYNQVIYERTNGEMNTFSTSYLKFRELRLGYNFSNRLIKKLKILQGANVALFATNLFSIDNYPQYDPDASAMNGSSIYRGIEIGAYPMTRTYGVNVKLAF